MRKIDTILQEVGMITLKFSKLEHLTLEYISVLISGVDTIDNYMIFQNDTLDKKLDTLRKLIQVKCRGQFEKQQLETIGKVNSLKSRRNLFIHGDWCNIQEALINDFETISVNDTKFKFNHKSNQDGIYVEKSWSPGQKINFTITDLNNMHSEIDLLILELTEHINSNMKANP